MITAREASYMRSYQQYCPVARGAEVFAERWTPIIMRNILFGCETFNQIADGAPGLSRSLLTKRLRELERAGVITIIQKEHGHGSLYLPTEAGLALEPVLNALGAWGEMWMEVRPVHTEPGVVLWSWCQVYLKRDLLPKERVVVRFDFEYRGRPDRAWLLINKGEAELCATDPGYGEDLVVEVNDTMVFARWHLGHIDWANALRSGGITVRGRQDLRKALPTWNRRPEMGKRLRGAQGDARLIANLVYHLEEETPRPRVSHEPSPPIGRK
jgi:DNA-binding HxlR family transcriptional regulator